MKDSLFQILLDLFKNSLTNDLSDDEKQEMLNIEQSAEPIIVNRQSMKSERILSLEERTKLSDKSSHFLYQMIQAGLLNSEKTEEVLSKVGMSESYCVSLEELKWIMRDVLDYELSTDELAYLDLILYAEVKDFNLQ